MKNKSILLLLERYVDKIVLLLSILASLFLLWVFVVSQPYSEKIRFPSKGERSLGPSEIDRVIKEEAEVAVSGLDKPAPPPPVQSRDYLAEYSQLLQSSIPEISSSINFPLPGAGDEVQEDRTYVLPEIPSLSELAVVALRGAAKIPFEEIGPNNTYSSALSSADIGDIDLVTVSARLNIESLYSNFERSFMGIGLKAYEKDSRLATPVFARLELQRRVKDEKGNWRDWELVPRTSIDSNRKLLEELPLVLDGSSFGVDIWISQYDSQDVQYDILQPESYEFSISPVEWMAPEYQQEALAVIEKEEQQARREKLEDLREKRTERPDNMGRRTLNRRSQSRNTDRNIGGGMMPGLTNPTRTRTPRRPVQKEPTLEDVQKDFEKELLDEKSNLSNMRNPLLVWTHDDTVKPGMTYQYRMRIGVFNPIAGKDWFESGQEGYKDKLVLWSNYTEPTDEVSIPRQIYVFPMDVIVSKSPSSNIEGVQVQIAKYYLGQWWDFDFDVYPGEIIGYEVADVQDSDDSESGTSAYRPDSEPGLIDFTSDMTFVDVSSEVFWGSRLRRNVLYKMIYCDAEGKMKEIAIEKNNWDSDIRKTYADIQKAIEQGANKRDYGRGTDTPDMDALPGMMPGMPGMMPGM